jgi:PAS domain S-box-containing protein
MMSDRPETSPDPEVELTQLRQEVTQLRKIKTAFEVHQELTKSFINLQQKATKKLLLQSILRQSLQIAIKMTDSQHSSLFWLNDQGMVTDSILARGIAIREEKDSLIEQVLDKGLAGWVYYHRQIGLISDTKTDPRWMELPYQPYKVGSVLCIPIIRGKFCFAILTLMHAETGHFNPELVELMKICTEQMALVLEEVKFHEDHFPPIAETVTESPETPPIVDIKQPIANLSLEPELNQLRNFKTAFEVQKELMRSFVNLLQRATGKLLIRSMLRQTLEICVRMTDSQESSLFWLNEEGVVTESILARGIVIREEKDTLIGEVLEKGLAGWVYNHRQVGLVADTSKDSRWIDLPYQPYKVGSVLCIPIIRGKVVLAILTLMHPEPDHFNPELTELMRLCSDQIALVLDQVKFYSENFKVSQATQTNVTSQQGATPAKFREPLSDLALFIIAEEGRFIYVEQKLADILGYTMGDLVALGSLLAIATEDHREALARRIYQCFSGEHDQILVAFKGLCANKSWLKLEIYGKKTKLFGKTIILGTLRIF